MRARSSLFAVLALCLVLAASEAGGAPVQGDDTNAFFVAVGGNNSGPGTMAQPLASIQAAITQAQSSATRKTILVSKGTYAENVTLSGSPLSLYGGFDSTDGWSRKSTNVTAIAPTVWTSTTYPLRIAFASNTVVDGFTIVAPNAPATPAGAAGSSIAVYLDSSSRPTLSFNTIASGTGGTGSAATANGGMGSIGGPGQAGLGNGQGGAAGGGACGFGGNGGSGGFGSAGAAGATGVGPGGAGGAGGTNGVCPSAGGTGGNGTIGPDGAIGSGGAAGSGGAVNATFGWLAGVGGIGSFGSNGLGGGGGGGGGGAKNGFACTNSASGGGGGGGGGGGCRGGGGSGAQGGGSSIAIFGRNSIDANVFGGAITTGGGGSGGKGANGASGGAGGNGGAGAAASSSPGGLGGNGGKGGNGGQGGGGGGGAGGANFGIILSGGDLHQDGSIALGAPGAGGAGGLPNGVAGIAGSNAALTGNVIAATMRQLDVATAAIGLASGTVRSDSGWIDCAPDCTQKYADGIVVRLYALPSTTPDSDFGGWSGACTGTDPICQVTMSADQTVTATFVVRKYTLDLSRDGNGTGSVASVPPGIDCGATCAAPFDSGTMVTLTPTPGAYSTFTGWSGACMGTGPCVVTVDAAKSVTATFTLVKLALDVATSGPGSGSVASSPVGIDCGATCNAQFDALTVVTLAPTPSQFSVFSGWSGACTGTGACVVTMDTAKSVTASFGTVSFVLTVSKAGNGSGGVTSSPAGIDCGATCAAPFIAPGQVTLTATAAPGSSFASWSGCDSATANQCTVAMTAGRGVTATFTTPITYNVVLEGFQEVPWAITPATGGGTAFYDPLTRQLTLSLGYAGLTGTESVAHIHGLGARGASGGALFMLSTARPKQDMVVLTSQQEAQLLAGQLYVDIHTSTHPDGEIRGQIDNLGAAVRRTLTVVKAGDGSGSVSGTAEPGQVIACGGLCSRTLPDGKVVTLTAVAVEGSSFAGWSGACTGTGLCALTMNAPATVTATFTTATGGSADLAATQAAHPNPASAGKDVILELTATNYGPSAATSVALSSDVTGAALVWRSPGCSGSGVVTCDAGSLAVGASATFTVVVRPPSAGAITSIVVATAAEADPASPNNGSFATIAVNATPPGVPTLRYRLYSPATLEHHYTTDLNEYNTLGTYAGAWVQEGTAGSVLDNPGPFNGVDAVPYYRLYNTGTRWHHWTTDANEYYTLGFVYSTWNMEGVDGWILPTSAAGTTQLYRLNYPALGALHHWTIDANEYNTLITPAYGWVGEGGSGFVIQ